MSLNASLEPYNGSRSQKSHNNIRRMLSVVYFHCKTIRNVANITAHFEKSRCKIRKKSREVLEGLTSNFMKHYYNFEKLFSILNEIYACDILICWCGSRNVSYYYQFWKGLCRLVKFLFFCAKHDTFYLFLMFKFKRATSNSSSKEQYLCEIELLCNIINVFTVTFV